MKTLSFPYITSFPASHNFTISGIDSGGSCKSASIITIASPVTSYRPAVTAA